MKSKRKNYQSVDHDATQAGLREQDLNQQWVPEMQDTSWPRELSDTTPPKELSEQGVQEIGQGGIPLRELPAL